MVSSQCIYPQSIVLDKHIQFYLPVLKIISSLWGFGIIYQKTGYCNEKSRLRTAVSMRILPKLTLCLRSFPWEKYLLPYYCDKTPGRNRGGGDILPLSFRLLQCTKGRREGGTDTSRTTEMWNIKCPHHNWPDRGTGQTKDWQVIGRKQWSGANSCLLGRLRDHGRIVWALSLLPFAVL